MIPGKPRRKTKAPVKVMKVRGDVLQQLTPDNESFVFLPVLYVEDKLTTIQGEKAIPSLSQARKIAAKHAAKIRGAFYAPAR